MEFGFGTLLTTLTIVSLTLAGSVLVVAWGRGNRDGLVYWSAGLALYGLSVAGFALRFSGWSAVSIVLTNLLVAAMLSAHAIAIADFHRRSLPAWTIWLPLLLAGIISVALAGQHPLRNALLALVFMAQSVMLTRLAWTPPGGAIPRERGRILLATGCSLLVLMFAVRSATILVLADAQGPMGVNADVQRLSYLLSLVVLLLNTVGFLLMHKERAEALLREEATHDALTGILNRRALQQALVRELSTSDRIGRPLALVMIDIDHFKQVNDRFGHVAGDDVLCEVTRRMQQRLRTNDVLGRFGGEEFLLVLPATDAQGALALAEDIRHEFDRPVIRGDVPISITVSAGVHAFMPQAHGTSGHDPRSSRDSVLDRMIQAADCALYRAKQAGRNRCEVEA